MTGRDRHDALSAHLLTGNTIDEGVAEGVGIGDIAVQVIGRRAHAAEGIGGDGIGTVGQTNDVLIHIHLLLLVELIEQSALLGVVVTEATLGVHEAPAIHRVGTVLILEARGNEYSGVVNGVVVRSHFIGDHQLGAQFRNLCEISLHLLVLDGKVLHTFVNLSIELQSSILGLLRSRRSHGQGLQFLDSLNECLEGSHRSRGLLHGIEESREGVEHHLAVGAGLSLHTLVDGSLEGVESGLAHALNRLAVLDIGSSVLECECELGSNDVGLETFINHLEVIPAYPLVRIVEFTLDTNAEHITGLGNQTEGSTLIEVVGEGDTRVGHIVDEPDGVTILSLSLKGSGTHQILGLEEFTLLYNLVIDALQRRRIAVGIHGDGGWLLPLHVLGINRPSIGIATGTEEALESDGVYAHGSVLHFLVYIKLAVKLLSTLVVLRTIHCG